MSFTLTNSLQSIQLLNGHALAVAGAVTLDTLSEDALAAVAASKASVTINAANANVGAAMTLTTITDSSGGTSAAIASKAVTVPAHAAASTATLVTIANALIVDMKNIWAAIASLQTQLNQHQIVEQ